MANPFETLFDGMWSMLEAHAGFTSLVPVGNRIKFSGTKDTDPTKDAIQDSDVPEVRIIVASLVPHLQRTSNMSTLLSVFQIQISSGDMRFAENFFPVVWEIYKAMSKWAATFDALTWEGKKFLLPARPQEAQVGLFQSDLQRNIKGWSTVWAVEVEMYLDTSDMQA